MLRATLPLLVASIAFSPWAVAQSSTCDDEASAVAAVRSVNDQVAAMARSQNEAWERYTKEMEAKAAALGWNGVRRRAVMTSVLSSAAYRQSESEKEPFTQRILAWAGVLKAVQGGAPIREACLVSADALVAFENQLKISLRQYDLAFRMLAQEE